MAERLQEIARTSNPRLNTFLNVEVAENYRQVLRSAPDEWDARYNLERAQRLVPEPEPGDDELPDLKRNAERAATTMRAYSPGLP